MFFINLPTAKFLHNTTYFRHLNERGLST